VKVKYEVCGAPKNASCAECDAQIAHIKKHGGSPQMPDEPLELSTLAVEGYDPIVVCSYHLNQFVSQQHGHPR
jgi:hypothetical protein